MAELKRAYPDETGRKIERDSFITDHAWMNFNAFVRLYDEWIVGGGNTLDAAMSNLAAQVKKMRDEQFAVERQAAINAEKMETEVMLAELKRRGLLVAVEPKGGGA